MTNTREELVFTPSTRRLPIEGWEFVVFAILGQLVKKDIESYARRLHATTEIVKKHYGDFVRPEGFHMPVPTLAGKTISFIDEIIEDWFKTMAAGGDKTDLSQSDLDKLFDDVKVES